VLAAGYVTLKWPMFAEAVLENNYTLCHAKLLKFAPGKN
jgi:hypothetical protein